MSGSKQAVEVLEHRRISPIGTIQHHYRLDKELAVGQHMTSDVAVIPYSDTPYCFANPEDAQIVDALMAVLDPAVDAAFARDRDPNVVYIYPADRHGVITDWWSRTAMWQVTDPDDALGQLGYRCITALAS